LVKIDPKSPSLIDKKKKSFDDQGLRNGREREKENINIYI